MEEVYEKPIKNSRKYIAEAKTTPKNKETMQKYLDAMMTYELPKVRSDNTIRGNIFCLKLYAEWLNNKDLNDVEKQDFTNFSLYLREKGLAKTTTGLYLTRIKSFYTWFFNGKNTDSFSWIKPAKHTTQLEDFNLITPSEIKAMIESAGSNRNKFLIAGLYESGCRVSEWINIRLKDVILDQFGAKIKVSGKTGTRNIRLIDSVPYLTIWLNEHPFKHDRERYLFTNFAPNYYGRRLFAPTIGVILKTSAKRSGINKKIHPHLLRHSRIGWLATHEGLNERDLRIFAGWSSTSDMPNTYLHYGEEEVDRKLRKARGLENIEESEQETLNRTALLPKICPRCSKQNPADSKYCNCGMILDLKEVMKVEQLREEANTFTDKLLKQPINKEDMNQGLLEALYQTMKNNSELVQEFREMLDK